MILVHRNDIAITGLPLRCNGSSHPDDCMIDRCEPIIVARLPDQPQHQSTNVLDQLMATLMPNLTS